MKSALLSTFNPNGLISTVAALLLLFSVDALGEEPWKPASAPLMTRWAKDVSPEHARPEYPRPLLVRKDWKSLNGIWQFAFDDAATGRDSGWTTGKDLPERILVPFTFESALSGIGKGKEIHEHVWYRRTFEIPPAWKGRHVRINFGASDWETTVWVNGKEVTTHRGGYTPFTADITDALKLAGDQELVVAIYDPANPRGAGWQPKGKQLGSEGIWYTRTTGIWQTVWIEPVTQYHIDSITVNPEIAPDSGTASLLVKLHTAGAGPMKESEATVDISRGGHTITGRVKVAGGPLGTPALKLAIPNPDFWTPETPNLYDLKVTLRQDGRVVDEVKSYCAVRTVGIANGRLTLNGKPYFYRGVLDQGFWPDGIYTPPTDAAIRADVETTKKLGFNMARKHVKVEDPRWYYWCDHLGLAVWQDMPSSHNLSTEAAKENFEHEWTAEIADLRSYPCVVHWIPFNENWGDPREYQDHIVTLTRALDSSRPITDASGWTQRGLTDVIDAHDYGNNLLRQGVKNPIKPKVVGEYGGIALPVPGHTWTTGWGYQTVRDPDGLVRKIRAQTSQLFEAENLSGYVYTQLTDVEQELNGLMTYDRNLKAPIEKIAPVFEGKDRVAYTSEGYITKWLVLGPIPSGITLPSARDDAANQDFMGKILDRPYLQSEAELDPKDGESVQAGGATYRWQQVASPDDQLDFHKVFGGQHDNAVAYAVAVFDSPRAVQKAALLFGSDDGAVVWLNGKKVHTVNHIRGVTPDQDSVPGLSLKAGRNILVVKVGQGVGGWGLIARIELPDGKMLIAK